MSKFTPNINHSSNKQYMLPKYKFPTEAKREEIENIYFDSRIMRIYVDASELKRQGIFGLGAIFVGAGHISIESKKDYRPDLKGQMWFAETMAICYALDLIPEIIINRFEDISEILLYSDLHMLQSINEKTKNKTKLFVLEQVELSLARLNKRLENPLKVEIHFLNNEQKRFNPYYAAAHNASRKIIGLKG
jgi:hypothetical protein